MLQMYTLAVAGPNGVELYQIAIADNFKMVTANSLHSKKNHVIEHAMIGQVKINIIALSHSLYMPF